MKIHIDFETRSPVDLEDVGIDVYTRDPNADVWCLGYAYDDGEPHLWYPGLPTPGLMFPVGHHAPLYAHNAQFEIAVWNNIMVPKYGWPAVPASQFRCTMCMGYAMGFPGKLDHVAAALGLKVRKDMAGNRLAAQMSRPRTCASCENKGCKKCADWWEPGYVWWDDLDRKLELYEYCKQDVRVEQAVCNSLLNLSPSEQALWVVDCAINQRGIYVDIPAIKAAQEIVYAEQQRLSKELFTLTEGAVHTPSQVTALTKWCATQGVTIDSLAKQELIDALEDIPVGPARRSLEIRQEYAKTSVAKLAKMRESASADSRLRYILQFGAAGTGRWGGRRVQPQNMPRPKLKQQDIDALLDLIPNTTPEHAIAVMDTMYGAPMNVISDLLRGVLRAAPGCRLYAGDFSNIEGRGIAWLAGEEWKLQAFRDFDAGVGPDLYLLAASRIYGKPVDSYTKSSPERQIGKVAELACGYQGGVGAFQTMATTYGVKVPDEEAEFIKTAWREAHPHIVKWWYELDRAAVSAVLNPGSSVAAGRVKFLKSGSFLFCELPSKRVLCYPYPSIVPTETWWGELKDQVHYYSVDDRTKQWTETNTYGGKLAENITQAVARDILAFAITNFSKALWPIVLHVHDEVVCELPDNVDQETALAEMQEIMEQVPPWAEGFPISVECWSGVRYRK